MWPFFSFQRKSKLFELSNTEQNYLKYMKLAVKIVKHNHSFDCFLAA